VITLATALLGALGWTLAEYLIHRFQGHGKRPQTSAFGKEHLQHHARVDYFAPLGKKIALSVPPLALLTGASVFVLGWQLGLTFSGGFAFTYAAYEWLHLRLHTHGPRSAWGMFLRRHHFFHHYSDARTNHGVTSPLWDHVFRTYRAVHTLKVPAHRAPVWLQLGPGEELSAALAGSFELVTRKRRGR